MLLISDKFNTQSGATTVEFAFVIYLILLPLLFAIIELGFITFNRHILNDACREGARFGIVLRAPRHSDQEIMSAVRKHAESHLITFSKDNFQIIFPQGIQRVANDGTTCNTSGCNLIVRATYNYNYLFLSIFGFDPVVLDSTAKMRLE